jgi:hypothetical protein
MSMQDMWVGTRLSSQNLGQENQVSSGSRFGTCERSGINVVLMSMLSVVSLYSQIPGLRTSALLGLDKLAKTAGGG